MGERDGGLAVFSFPKGNKGNEICAKIEFNKNDIKTALKEDLSHLLDNSDWSRVASYAIAKRWEELNAIERV